MRTRLTRTARLAVAGTAAAALLLAGCGTDGDADDVAADPTDDATTAAEAPAEGQEGESEAPADQEPVELKIAWWGNDERAAIMTEVIDMFEEKYPYITVVEEPVGAPDDLFNRLATDFASDTAPDVFALGGAKPQEYGAAGTLLDLSTVSDVLDIESYADFTLTNAIVDDTLYGLPTGGNAIGTVINTTILEEAGIEVPGDDWTWEDLSEIATQVSNEVDGVVGLDLRIQDILGTYVAQYVEEGMYSWEGDLAVGPDIIQQWYEYEQSLVESGALPDPAVIVEHHNVTPDQSLFGTGKAAIAFSYSNQIPAYAAGTGGAEVVMVPPPSSTDLSGVAVLPSQFWAIAAGSDHPTEAAMLVDWLLNDTEAAQVILANRGLQFNPEVLEAIRPNLSPEDAQAAEYLEKVLETGLVAAPQPAGGAILNELSQRIESDILFGRTTPEAGAQQWVEELSASLEDAQ